MKTKRLIVLAGGSGAGKTTTTNAFARGAYVEHKVLRNVPTQKGVRPMDVHWTVYENCAVAGNRNGTSDSNIGPGAMRESLYECLAVRDIVILDGYVSSPQWPVFCNEWEEAHPECELEILLVHFDLSVEELMRRKAVRLGISINDHPPHVRARCEEGVARPKRLISQFMDLSDQTIISMKVFAEDSTEVIVDLLTKVLEELQ